LVTTPHSAGVSAEEAAGTSTGSSYDSNDSSGSSGEDSTAVDLDSGVESASVFAAAVPEGMPEGVLLTPGRRTAQYENFSPSSAMVEFEQRASAASQRTLNRDADGAAAITSTPDALDEPAVSVSSRDAVAVMASVGAQQEVWRGLQQRYSWPAGQVVFQSLYRPCEKVGMCREDCDTGREFAAAGAMP
jgi:hypothetical protein